VLYDLAHAGCELLFGQCFQCFDIDIDQRGLMKSPYKIFDSGEVHGCFSANACVYLGKQARGHLNKSNAPHVCGGCQPADIPYYAASQSHGNRASVHLIFQEK
jgi:hypothetical protein